MSDGIDLRAYDELAAEFAAATRALDDRLDARRNEPGVEYNQRRLRAEQSDDLRHLEATIRRVRGRLPYLQTTPRIETTTATSRDVAPETREEQP